jgi:hypothetical protein
MNPSDVLPRLVSLYKQGFLVPFIGSGMSSPICNSWDNFLTSLAQQVGMPVGEKAKGDESAPKYRLADRIVTRLAHIPPDASAQIYRNALKNEKQSGTDTSTNELAKLYWPLVITTNYDDVYCAAALAETKRRTKNFFGEQPRLESLGAPEIAGRSIADCHKILRSLDSSCPPLLWAVQGYVGGIIEDPGSFEVNRQKLNELARQIVVGHQQYQRAINDQPHFRRAFAEVCRRRSLLFLGSGIAEDYLLNLFGEVVHHHGLSPHGHYALFPESKSGEVDKQFLTTRLGIVPVFYNERDGHVELRSFLKELADQSSINLRSVDANNKMFSQCELGFLGRKGVKVTLKYSSLNWSVCCDPNVAILLSVGRDSPNIPRLGNQVESVIGSTSIRDWLPIDEQPSYLFRNRQKPQAFALAARDRQSTRPSRDIRSLHCIPEALCVALTEISKSYNKVHLAAVASGKSSFCHPVHPFVQMLRGIRKFLSDGSETDNLIQEIVIDIVHPGVWADIVSDKLSILENLNSDMAPVTVEVHLGINHYETYTLILPYGSSIKYVIDYLGMVTSEWDWELYPPPGDFAELEITEDERILPTMILRLSPSNKSQEKES